MSIRPIQAGDRYKSKRSRKVFVVHTAKHPEMPDYAMGVFEGTEATYGHRCQLILRGKLHNATLLEARA